MTGREKGSLFLSVSSLKKKIKDTAKERRREVRDERKRTVITCNMLPAANYMKCFAHVHEMGTNRAETNTMRAVIKKKVGGCS